MNTYEQIVRELRTTQPLRSVKVMAGDPPQFDCDWCGEGEDPFATDADSFKHEPNCLWWRSKQATEQLPSEAQSRIYQIEATGLTTDHEVWNSEHGEWMRVVVLQADSWGAALMFPDGDPLDWHFDRPDLHILVRDRVNRP